MKNKLLKEKKLAQSRNNWREVANLSNALGGSLQESGNLEEALEHHRDELQACNILGDKLGCGVAHRRIGEVLFDMGKSKEALDHQKLHLQLAVEAKSVLEQQRAYATLGRTYLERGYATNRISGRNKELDLAKVNFLESLAKCKALAPDEIPRKEHSLMRARIYLNLGMVTELKNDCNLAIDMLTKASAITREHSFTEDLFKCHYNLASIHLKMKRYNTALEETKFLVTLSNKLSSLLKIDSLILLGKVYLFTDNLSDAKANYSKAYKIALKEKEDGVLYKTMLHAVHRLHKLGPIDSQDILQDELLKKLEKMGDDYATLKHYDKAIDCYKQVIDEASAIGKPEISLAPIYYSIASTYQENRQYKLAKQYLNIEYKLRLTNDPKEACRTLLSIAEVSEWLDEEELKVVEFYKEALTLAEKANNPKLHVHVLENYLKFSHISNEEKCRLEKQMNDLIEENDIDPNCDSSDDELVEDCDDDLSDLSSESEDEEKRVNTTVYSRNTINCKKNWKVNLQGETPLHIACRDGKLNTVRSLLSEGHSMSVRDNAGWQPIHEACNEGHLEVVQILVSKGSPINDKGCDGITPLHDACVNGHIDIVNFLVGAGASPIVRADDGSVALNALETFFDKDLDDAERKELQDTVARVKAAMEKLGHKASITKTLKSANVKEKHKGDQMKNKHLKDVVMSLGKENLSDDEVDEEVMSINQPLLEQSSLPKKGAVKSYRDAIGSLGSATSRSPFVPTSAGKKSRVKGLLRAEDIVGDDFIEDDLACSNPRKRKRPKSVLEFVSSKREKRSPDLSRTNHSSASSVASRSSSASSSFSKSKQMTLPDVYERFSPIPLIEDASDDEAPTVGDFIEPDALDQEAIFQSIVRSNRPNPREAKPVSTSAPPKPSSAPAQPTSALRLHIAVEGKVLLVPVAESSLGCSIEWLCNEVARRYYQLNGIKPQICLETSSGAMLLPSDLISSVIGSGDNLKANVTGWSLPPLTSRYTEECRQLGCSPCGDITMAMSVAESQAVLDISEEGYDVMDLRPVLRAVQRHHNLHTLNLSHNKVGPEGFSLLLDSIVLLPGLVKLSLQTTCLTSKCLADWSDRLLAGAYSNCQLTSLDLSYNSLTGSSLVHIDALLSLPKINSLDLSNCWLRIENSSNVRNNSTLSHLNLDHNHLSVGPLKELLSKLTALKSLSLRAVNKGASDFSSVLTNLLGAGDECQLEHLNLSHNHLTSCDIENISPYIYRCSSLNTLDLSYNDNVSSQSVTGLLKELENNIKVPVKCISLHGMKCSAETTVVHALHRLLQAKSGLMKPVQSLSVRQSQDIETVIDMWRRLNVKADVNHLGEQIFLTT